MRTLPGAMVATVAAVAPLFSRRVWGRARVLLAGAVLAPARRTVSAALRVAGLVRVARLAASSRPRPVVGRSGCRRRRRDAGALRQVDRRQGHRPRRGALQPGHFIKASGPRRVCRTRLVPGRCRC